MTEKIGKIISCSILATFLAVLLLISSRNPLETCPVSSYTVDEYWVHKQHYVVAEYPYA